MASMSDYLENKLIDALFRGGSYTFPTTVYIALFTAAPSDSGGGTEVSGSSYARVAVTCNATNWASTGGATTTTNPSAGTSGTTSNNAVITFPTPSGSWGTITHVGIFDAATTGNLLFWGALTTSLAVTGSSTPFSFPISALTNQLDN